jgi:hypothetical protein
MKLFVFLVICSCFLSGCFLVPEEDSNEISINECVHLHAAWHQRRAEALTLGLPFIEPAPSCPLVRHYE